MASKQKSGGSTAGTPNVADLIASATGTQSTNQQALLEARQAVIGQIESLAGDLTSLDQTLGTIGFDGDLAQPNVSFGGSTPAAPALKPKRRSTASTGGARGSKTVPLEDAICHALANGADGVGMPKGDGMSLADIVAGVQAAPINYVFSGSESNQRTLVSQRMSGLVSGGWVEQVAIEGRSRGLPFRLTSEGRTWVRQNAIG